MPFSIQTKSFDELLSASRDKSYLAGPKVAETACTWGRLRWPSFWELRPGCRDRANQLCRGKKSNLFWCHCEPWRSLDILISVLRTILRKLKAGNNSIKKYFREARGCKQVRMSHCVLGCSNIHPGEKLLQVSYKDLSLLLDELLAAELEVSVDIFLRVDVVFLYFRCPLGATETKGFCTIKWHFTSGKMLSKCGKSEL